MKTKKRRIGLFTKIAIVVFTVYAAITLIGLQIQINIKQDEAQEIQRRLNEVTAKNLSIQAAIDSDLTDEVIAAQAREKLDLAAPGERVFVDTSN